MNIRDGVAGKFYLSPKGLKIQFLRKRVDSDYVVIKNLASGGHELVVPGDMQVEADVSFDQVIITPEEQPTGRRRLALLVQRILQESGMAVAEIADITGIVPGVVQDHLDKLLSQEGN